jgi:hypothetical protein
MRRSFAHAVHAIDPVLDTDDGAGALDGRSPLFCARLDVIQLHCRYNNIGIVNMVSLLRVFDTFHLKIASRATQTDSSGFNLAARSIADAECDVVLGECQSSSEVGANGSSTNDKDFHVGLPNMTFDFVHPIALG